MYHTISSAGRKRKNLRSFNGATPPKRPSSRYQQERVRLAQLFICLLLFLTVLIGKGAFPQQLIQVRDHILTMITDDFDFQAAFSRLGESLSGEGSVLGEFGEFCVEVFAPESDEQQTGSGTTAVPELTSLLTSESQFFSRNPDSAALAEHYLSSNRSQMNLWPAGEDDSYQEQVPTQAQQVQTEEPEAVAAAGTVLLKADYSGQPLPNNYTMDQLSLGDLETVTPVLGHINSVYGYRDHPINGNYQFHGGVDIGGQMGNPIQAFAAGTVEYVGQDDSYGLYFQIDHGNGVKSFYAHCSAVCVKKGESVTLGQKVAEVGASGAATGPHLHLELKWNQMHINPIYYIEYLTDQ